MPAPTPLTFPDGLATIQTVNRQVYFVPTIPFGVYMFSITSGIGTVGTSGTISSCSLKILYNAATYGWQTNDFTSTPPINSVSYIQTVTGIFQSSGINSGSINQEITYIGAGAKFTTSPTANFLCRMVRIA